MISEETFLVLLVLGLIVTVAWGLFWVIFLDSSSWELALTLVEVVP